MEHSDKKQQITKTIFGIVVGIGVIVLIQQVFFPKPSHDEALMEVASELNKSLPMMVDEDTRLDNVTALPNSIFQYNYTLVNMEKATLDIDALTNYLEPTIVNNVKTNPELKMYRDNRITMNYHYKDKNGEFITKIEVTPDKYQD